jgi:hypothetical protein
MESIKVTIQYGPEDLQSAYALHFRKLYPVRSRMVLILGTILVFFGILLVVLQSLTGLISWMPWAFLLYGILVIAYYYWRYGRMGKTAFKKLVNFHYPFTFTISPEGLNTVGKNVSSNNNWNYYQIAIVTDRMIILYPNKLNLVMLPKKYFSDEEFSQLTEWVRTNVKKVK